MAYFLENSPLSAYTGGENGLPGVPVPTLGFGATAIPIGTGLPMYWLLAVFFLVGFILARRIAHSPFGVVLRAIKENTARAAMIGHSVPQYKLAAFVIAALYAGLAGGLLGVFQSYMPPDAFALDTSGQLVVQTVIGGVGTLIGPTVGAAIWLWLRDNLQAVPGVGALWKLILGVIFIVLVTVLRRGICGEIRYRATRRARAAAEAAAAAQPIAELGEARALALPLAAPLIHAQPGVPALRAIDVAKHYGGIRAVDGVSFEVPRELDSRGDRSERRRQVDPVQDAAGRGAADRRARCSCSAGASPAWAPRAPRSSASARATSSTNCSWS